MRNANEHTGLYLITPSALQSMFVLDADRQYFSRPVPVLPVPYTGDPGDGLTIVFDPTRGQTYPVSRKHLCPWHRMSRTVRQLAHRIALDAAAHGTGQASVDAYEALYGARS